MKEIQLTKGKTALVDDEDYERLIQFKWCAYQKRNTCYGGHKFGERMILMHRYVMHAPEDLDVDHVDRNGLNNQKSNLRFCNQSQNSANAKLCINNTSGARGVSWEAGRNKWRAAIMAKGNRRILGRFTTKEEAIAIYDAAMKVNFGEFALTNQMRQKNFLSDT